MIACSRCHRPEVARRRPRAVRNADDPHLLTRYPFFSHQLGRATRSPSRRKSPSNAGCDQGPARSRVIRSSPLGGEGMSDQPSADDRNRVSRRRMLKRIGAGTAVVWTAPVLTSIQTPAFAQASPGCDCLPFDCSPNAQTCPDGNCWCTPHHGGGPCVCFSEGKCFPCSSDDDCAAGRVCADVGPNCNCGPSNTGCVLPCS
jgi:hypothetical protein